MLHAPRCSDICRHSTQNEQKVVPMPDREFDNDTYFISRTDILHFLKEKIDTEFKGKIEMRFETLVKSVKRDPTNLNSGFTVSLFPAKGQPYNMVAPFVIGTSGAQTHVQEVTTCSLSYSQETRRGMGGEGGLACGPQCSKPTPTHTVALICR